MMTVHQSTRRINTINKARMPRLAILAMILGPLVWLGIAVALNANTLTWTRFDVLRITLVSLATLALCIIPGLALVQLCWRDAPLTWPERMTLGWGIGAGLPPILLMALHLLRLPWPVWASFVYVLGSGVALALLLIRARGQGAGVGEQESNVATPYLVSDQGSGVGEQESNVATPYLVSHQTTPPSPTLPLPHAPTPPRSHSPTPPFPHAPTPPRSHVLHGVLLIGLTLVALFARLVMVRNTLVGPYVDSYHHTLIAQLLVDHRGLFTSWEPYAPLSTFTYHYGFHSLVAIVHDLTTLPVWQLEPLVAQVLAAAIVPSMALLTFRLTASRWAGLWAALLVGFVNNQPAYYVVWGRSTSLTSHMILIALIVCWIAAVESPRLRPGLIALSALCCAGLVYTHYQTTLIAVIYLSIYMALLVLRAPTTRAALPELGRATLIVLIALLITAPWLINTISGELDRNVVYNSDRQSTEAFAGLLVPRLTPFYLHPVVLPLAIIALMIGLRIRRWRLVMLGAWAMTSMLVAFPYIFNLPGTGVLEPNFMALMLYLCLLPLAAYPLGLLQAIADPQPHTALPVSEQASRSDTSAAQMSEAAPTRARSARRLLAALIHALAVLTLIAVSIWGISWQRDLLPADHRMVTAADMQAFEWIRNNTATDARFFVQSHPLYGGTMIVGTDAGWWMPLLAGRQTNVPPMTYGSEQSIPADWGVQINKLAATTRGAPLSNLKNRGVDLTRPESQNALRQANISYIYIGAQPLKGDKAFGAVDRIDVDKLRKSPDVRLVYDQDGVFIFELVR